VNATEGGSHIAGFEECTLEEVLKGMPEQSITSQSLASAAAAARPPIEAEWVKAWAERQAELAREAGTAASRLRDAVEEAKAAIAVGNPKKVTASFRELARLEDELRTVCSEQPFLEGWAYAHFHDLMLTERIGAPEGDTQAEASWGLDREARMAEVLAEAARELDVALSDISKRMSSRKTMARLSHIKTDT
jgi:hypothetical protein